MRFNLVLIEGYSLWCDGKQVIAPVSENGEYTYTITGLSYASFSDVHNLVIKDIDGNVLSSLFINAYQYLHQAIEKNKAASTEEKHLMQILSLIAYECQNYGN